MGKKRIYELAKEMNQSSKDVVEKAHALGMDVKNHMGAISSEEESKLRSSFGGNKPASTQQKSAPKPQVAQSGQGQTKPANPKPANQNGNRPNQTQQRPQQQNGQQNRPQQNNQNRPAQQGQQNNQNRNNQNRNMQGSSQNMTQNRSNQGQQNRPQQNNQNQNRPAQAGQQNNQNRNNTQNRNSQGNTPSTNQNRNTQSNTQNTNQNRPAAQAGQQNRPQQGQASNNSQGNQNRNNTNSGNRNNSFGGGGGQNRNRNGYNNQNRNRFNKKGKKGKYQESTKPAVPARKFRELPDVLEYTEGMNVADIAKKIHREPAEIIKKLFMMGVMVNQNQSLDKETIELLAVDYGMEPQEKIQVDVADIDKFFEPEALVEENLVTRPPVVTIMGHVDHGKTTLLDTLRNSRVTSGEAGGITQHIGAYQIDIDGKPITFLDTPGHAAFTSMRARGAGITDITILVVAADDGVMPQTVEAINHAKAAEVPIIVAVNKVDKPGANPDHVKQELSEHGLIPEEWGGDTIFVNISAKFNQNIDELLENILLIAEVEDLKADPTQRAIGTVIEARLDKGKGPVATLLVQQGSLRVGDPIVVGNTFGRVRVMTNDIGRRDKAVGPATPVEITGLNDVPQAGDRFVVFEDEKTARQAGEERGKRAQLEQRSSNNRVTLDNLFESLKEGELKDVNVIIKADVQGTAEALAASLQKIEVAGVRVKIVHSAVGAINESDVTLAAASNAIIIGFNVRPTPQAKQQSDQEEVDIRLHRIIYKAIEEIETAMKGMLDPEFEEKITGQMTVRELYKVSKVGTIAGCYVTEGSIRRDSGVRVIRDGIVIFEGKLSSLKRFKDDAKEVKLGFECGAMVENFNDLKVDDVIEGFVMEEIKQ
ncbi:translation initiation factor IF-2 [Enterococcus haemoperoxidus ATCC BAA-382]|uniref:Translation initiation factor IF-2 n=1 Tax=Enterococcus haemoperoxidus ATCC BAA-382 TaxID=1158608 RepID=R2THP8_9ENTE|nr:translation initiation factor IF-2 [Enterococcus haemoperoxidus]EOH99634.1 translation initiation factor IF-2 [Enterococcus haemoperoxidus ATCC BAA-382]EOT62626.1 translation initiation factor IF-2 [Enterococcus haemoperoxidus ATCC BAA-382]OJG55092.1 translation initiation factor IF-2 [Enterococcus haemoperoxidus]